jgi:hypothetical protein
VVIHDFYLMRIALSELEENAPAVVHGHGPLSPPIAFELVQTQTFQRTQIAKRFGDIQ